MKSDVHVTDTKQFNLLNGDTALLLNILPLPKEKLKVNNVLNESNNINHIPKRINKIINNHKDDVFSNRTGKFKDVKVELHIDIYVILVAQPERHIPVALREKVRNEIKKLEVNNIVEDIINEPCAEPVSSSPKGGKR